MFFSFLVIGSPPSGTRLGCYFVVGYWETLLGLVTERGEDRQLGVLETWLKKLGTTGQFGFKCRYTKKAVNADKEQ